MQYQCNIFQWLLLNEQPNVNLNAGGFLFCAVSLALQQKNNNKRSDIARTQPVVITGDEKRKD